ncbi:hypothetical protein MATR_21300 [Marivirga tractuosa]|uniref:Uncharacterized protein n=1 Tax=Marivirga tractuosa (strain ATCC 23168 / DSM 4126 / NBRC 15989 / NCIMB 1408 / VKM B-1430 / H-43) TaxID=643867 RepID=E4TLB6_MARTH|nr:hypothetical protein [Marivirga tractuosa]ADR20254.1 hypothetical protein Ftrac_0243 [Marivirga tractuosa DSM 4126]BDD15305.1 hypothetical protein MATR_21300 [Marivirga tractuosa]
MQNKIGFYLISFFIILFTNCSSDDLKNPIQFKSLNGLNIKLNLLNPEFIAKRELGKDAYNEPTLLDSLINVYKESINLQVELSANDSQGIELNRLTENYCYQNFYLKIDGQSFNPILVLIEDQQMISGKLIIHMIFSQPPAQIVDNSTNFKIQFDDLLFETGINQFQYSTKLINYNK